MNKDILLVHHKPGRIEGYDIVKNHAEKLSRKTGVKIKPLTIEEYLDKTYPPATIVFAYLILRGDHYDEVTNRARELNHKLIGHIPPELTAQAICKKHSSSTCSSMTLYYYPAHVQARRQYEDLKHLTQLVEKLCNINITPQKANHGSNPATGNGNGDCSDILALLPTKNGRGNLLKYMEDELVEWVLEKLENDFLATA